MSIDRLKLIIKTIRERTGFDVYVELDSFFDGISFTLRSTCAPFVKYRTIFSYEILTSTNLHPEEIIYKWAEEKASEWLEKELLC